MHSHAHAHTYTGSQALTGTLLLCIFTTLILKAIQAWAKFLPTAMKKMNLIKKRVNKHISKSRSRRHVNWVTRRNQKQEILFHIRYCYQDQAIRCCSFGKTRAWPEEILTVGRIRLFQSPGKRLKGDSVLHEKEKWFIKCWAMPHCLLHHFKPWCMSSPTINTLFFSSW